MSTSFSVGRLGSVLMIFLYMVTTGLGQKVVPRLRECRRQGQTEVVSKSSNKIHQTWGPPFSQALYTQNDTGHSVVACLQEQELATCSKFKLRLLVADKGRQPACQGASTKYVCKSFGAFEPPPPSVQIHETSLTEI